jgi:transposase
MVASATTATMQTSYEAVQRWTQRYEETKEVEDQQRSGRPRGTDEMQDTNIAVASRLDPFASPRTILHSIDLDVSEKTIARRLDEAGLHVRVARQQFQLTDDHKRQRLSFAEGYSRWTEEDWTTVFFADETQFLGAGHHGKSIVRRPDGTADSPEYCLDKLPHPVQVAAFASFSAAGPGFLGWFNGSLTGEFYGTLLQNYLMPSVRKHFVRGEDWWLLHDNASTHKSPPARLVMHRNAIRALDFPPYSPDLNPIENLWADVKKRIEKRPAANKSELEAIVREEWEETSEELCDKLARSMPKRIASVIERHGAYTDY